MPPAEKMRLRKELEKFHPVVKLWKRDDLVTGRWFTMFLERSLASMAASPTPPEVRERWKDNPTADDLADDIASWTIHEAIAATDAYQENLTGTEIKNFKEKKPGGEQRLTGDMVPMIAELIFTIKLDVDLVFFIAAAYEKVLTAAEFDLFCEAFGRGLGAFDFDKAKSGGNLTEQIGQKIFDRAIAQTLGSNLSDAQRKGFYAYYAKAIAKETRRLIEPLAKWEPPPKIDPAAAAAGMVSGESAEEEPAAY